MTKLWNEKDRSDRMKKKKRQDDTRIQKFKPKQCPCV